MRSHIVPSSVRVFPRVSTAALSLFAAVLTALVFGPGCAAFGGGGSAARASAAAAPAVTGVYAPGVPTSHPPFATFHASWKLRMSVPYAYLEHRGHYNDARALVSTLMREIDAQRIQVDGPPFVLFFDDPAQKPVGELVARVCVPIAGQRSPSSPLRYDVLPEANVAYAAVSGSYIAVPEAYPHLNAYLDRYDWELAGPIREIYVVPPGGIRDPSQLLCEIQFPVATRN